MELFPLCASHQGRLAAGSQEAQMRGYLGALQALMARLHHGNWKGRGSEICCSVSRIWGWAKSLCSIWRNNDFKILTPSKSSQNPRETFQNRSQMAQDAPKRQPGGSRVTKGRPRGVQGTPKRRPKDAQERPRAFKRRLRTPRKRVRDPKSSPGSSQKREFEGFRRIWKGYVHDALFCKRCFTIA